MRPISQTITQKLSHCRRDDATLYASLELSRATWLVTHYRPAARGCRSTRPLEVTVQHCSAC
jgi:hypothetical protein